MIAGTVVMESQTIQFAYNENAEAFMVTVQDGLSGEEVTRSFPAKVFASMLGIALNPSGEDNLLKFEDLEKWQPRENKFRLTP